MSELRASIITILLCLFLATVWQILEVLSSPVRNFFYFFSDTACSLGQGTGDRGQGRKRRPSASGRSGRRSGLSVMLRLDRSICCATQTGVDTTQGRSSDQVGGRRSPFPSCSDLIGASTPQTGLDTQHRGGPPIKSEGDDHRFRHAPT